MRRSHHGQRPRCILPSKSAQRGRALIDFVYEISCTGERSKHDAVQTWFDTHAGPAWLMLPELSALDVYDAVGIGAQDPFVNDGAGPLLQAMLQFRTVEALLRGIGDPRLARALPVAIGGVAVTGTMFERRHYPVAGEDRARPLRAPFSYVVRYHRPAADEAAFVANYLDDHPPLLARLPRIRSILCYLPIAAPAPLPAADYMIGNEVAFDTIDDFNSAMASPERQEARKHFNSFPPFAGRNTHYPMRRRQWLGGAVNSVTRDGAFD
jgi:uncharacterized protein (TIGR02118 family)